jgi:fructose-1,6-bisphosphatase/inositol monophosphatase family enzyme
MSTQAVIDFHLIRQWVIDAGKIALSQTADRNVDLKPDLTPVTAIDRQVEAYLLAQIDRHYPGHAVLAEEGSFRSGSDFTWIIDPIDGTRAFASGLPIWGISVGIFHVGEPYAGVFYMPGTGDLFWGTREEAFHNERPLVPQATVDLHSPLAFITVPSSFHRYFDTSFPRIRSFGSATAHLAYVAHGLATATVTRRIRIWDLAAVLPYLDISRTRLVYLNGDTFIAGDLLHGEAAPHPLVAAHDSIIDEILTFIKTKPGDDPSTLSK